MAWPIEPPIIFAIPSARTVQGVLPIPAAISIASPVPKIHKPIHSITRVEILGLVSIGLVELHHVVGTSFAGFRNERMAMFRERRVILEPN